MSKWIRRLWHSVFGQKNKNVHSDSDGPVAVPKDIFNRTVEDIVRGLPSLAERNLENRVKEIAKKTPKIMTDDEFAEFTSVILSVLPRDLDADVGQFWIVNREALVKLIPRWLKLRKDTGFFASGVDDTIDSRSIFPVTVDYSRTLKEMVAATGYLCMRSEINDNKLVINHVQTALDWGGPYRSSEVLEINNRRVKIVMRRLENILVDEAPQSLENLGLRPARLEEFLALSEKYPEISKLNYELIVPGSVYTDENGRRHFLCLTEAERVPFHERDENQTRRLTLRPTDERVNKHFMEWSLFLAVIKE